MSTEARDVIALTLASAFGNGPEKKHWYEEDADAVQTALEAAGLAIVPRADEWEWGVIAQGDRVPYWCNGETSARGVADNLPGQLVRRRPAGEPEVAP